jgi:two-component system response regulator MtrA
LGRVRFDFLAQGKDVPLDQLFRFPRPASNHLTLGPLQIDLQAHEVRRDNQPISLTPTEYRLLVTLAERPGQALDYQTLVRLILDYEAELWEAKELIKRHVFTLRQKIEPDPAQPALILNVRGVGYRTLRP